jgi:cytosine/uracil/thiamine/allantoin permease
MKDERYWNKDLAQIQVNKRNWKLFDFIILWVSMSATIATFMCGSSLIALGMN